MKLVLLSDTHCMHDRIAVPDGDVLVHAGDFSGHGTELEVFRFAAWLSERSHAHKIVIAGNHDAALERTPALDECFRSVGVTYLKDSGTTIDGIRFYGSPWQPEFCNWAFNLPRGAKLKAKWSLIQAGTDVLITHGPPFGIGDKTARGERVGCNDLRDAIDRVKPKLHVFGHIHEGYGTYHLNGTTFVNASICTAGYSPVNQPVVVEL